MLQITNSTACIGAEATGINLAEGLSETDFATLEAAFNARSVLCIRDQGLNADQYLTFATRLGAPDRVFLSHYAHPDYPDIMLVSNIQQEGRNIGHADAGRVWHTDMFYTAKPPRATLLHALEMPTADDGRILGATSFASAAHAYAGLDQVTKDLIQDRTAVHRVSGRRKKTGTGEQDNPLRDQQSDVVHPVARHNPVTGKPAFYVSEGECVSISGLPHADALSLVDRLAAKIQRPDYRYVHEWRKGDVLIWDNAAVQHLASFDYQWPDHRRLMWRITVGGTVLQHT